MDEDYYREVVMRERKADYPVDKHGEKIDVRVYGEGRKAPLKRKKLALPLEGQLSQALKKRIKARLPRAWVTKHNDATTGGIPDTSVTLHAAPREICGPIFTETKREAYGRVLWLEMKRGATLAACVKAVTPKQKDSLDRLSDAARLVAFTPSATYVVHPRTGQTHTFGARAYAEVADLVGAILEGE